MYRPLKPYTQVGSPQGAATQCANNKNQILLIHSLGILSNDMDLTFAVFLLQKALQQMFNKDVY